MGGHGAEVESIEVPEQIAKALLVLAHGFLVGRGFAAGRLA
jgi:hypothetical protein